MFGCIFLLFSSVFVHIPTILMRTQLHWAGHVAHMPNYRIPMKVLFGELQQGKHSHGGQRNGFKDSLKVSLKAFNIDQSSWEQTALDRTKWRAAVHNGAPPI
uniref:Uncharacterized protein n=1 Tax=Octopus bimaculoides TaxID=37653 RepID=A0A0L8G1T5_OCTBM